MVLTMMASIYSLEMVWLGMSDEITKNVLREFLSLFIRLPNTFWADQT